jgi:putative acyl-CoA dehydrogenase
MAVALALHHARCRSVFQRKLVDQPAMRMVLSDLALEAEAMAALSMRLASSFDAAAVSEREASYARIITPAAKFAICKAAPGLIYEAMESLGGNGYVEESPLPRLYREAPVNAIWEGSGNVMALDILRAAGRDPDDAAAVLDSLARDAAGLPGVSETRREILAALRSPEAEAHARFATDRLAALAAAAALARAAPAPVAESYALTRLASRRRMIGANDLGETCNLLLDRALPPL